MENDRIIGQKSVHQLAFAHYLRTGQQLTNAEWLALGERKFNPYHDELGRFTSPPGVTVSWGRSGRSPANAGGRSEVERTSPTTKRHTREHQRRSRGPVRNASQTADQSTGGFQSGFVRGAVSEAGNADTHWELNKRQAGLNRLREAAGPNPDSKVEADLDEIQARLNDNRRLLDQRYEVANQETTEILRAGLAPVDTAAGAINLLSGYGDLRDTLAVAGAVPVAGTIGKLAKLAMAGRVAEKIAERPAREIIQLGGAHRDIKGMPSYEAHHMPGNKVSPLRTGNGPAIVMLKEDHRALLTSKNSKAASEFRKIQSEHIVRGNFRAAMQMDIDLIRKNFESKYDEAIDQALKYSQEQGFIR